MDEPDDVPLPKNWKYLAKADYEKYKGSSKIMTRKQFISWVEAFNIPKDFFSLLTKVFEIGETDKEEDDIIKVERFVDIWETKYPYIAKVKK